MIKCFAQDSLSNYTQSVLALQTASGSAYLATPTPLSHSSPLLKIVFRLTKTRAKATRFGSSFTYSFSSSCLCLLLPSVSLTMNSNVRQTTRLSGNNQWHSWIQDSSRCPSVAAELAGVPAVSQSESDPDAPLFAQWEEMNEGAQWSRWKPTSTIVGFMTFFYLIIKEKNKFCLWRFLFPIKTPTNSDAILKLQYVDNSITSTGDSLLHKGPHFNREICWYTAELHIFLKSELIYQNGRWCKPIETANSSRTGYVGKLFLVTLSWQGKYYNIINNFTIMTTATHWNFGWHNFGCWGKKKAHKKSGASVTCY